MFLVCNDFLNCLRRVDTIVVTTESDLNNLKVVSTTKFFIEKIKAAIFAVLIYSLYDNSRNFKFKQK